MLIPKQATCAAGILFPFYIYPSKVNSCDQWTPMITALNDHPDLPFTLIINPDSGPGSGSTPDSQYQDCLPTLRGTMNSNVLLIGYVYTSYGTRSSSDVEADISTYNNWPSSYKPDGIFFDEVPTNLSYANTYSSYVDYVNDLTWNDDNAYVTYSIFKDNYSN
jgi:hypothetical protein